MDDGYWAALLRDVEEEPDAARTAEGEEAVAGGGAGARRWAVSAGADSEVDWQRAETLLADGEVADVRISGFNRGGLLADFGALQGFIPASHLTAPLPGQSQEQRAAGPGCADQRDAQRAGRRDRPQPLPPDPLRATRAR